MVVHFFHPGVGFFFEFPLRAAEIGPVVGNETAETRAPRVEALERVNERSDIEAVCHFTMNRTGDGAAQWPVPGVKCTIGTE